MLAMTAATASVTGFVSRVEIRRSTSLGWLELGPVKVKPTSTRQKLFE